jgi:hypothetical protein
MRLGTYVAFLTICAIVVLVGGCGKNDGGGGGTGQGAAMEQSQGASQTTTQSQTSAQPPAGAGEMSGVPSPADVSAMAEQNRQALAQMNQGKQIAAVTAASLKGQLPETLAGMKRTGASAERNQMMGIDMTIAEGQYEGQNDASVGLTITDVGNLSGPMRMGMVGWTMAEYSRETDTGYEKTTTYSGYKGTEEYDNESKSGTIRVFVADRFIVELEGSNTTMDALKKALSQIDLKKIASLASGS